MGFTFKQFNDLYPDDDACLEALFAMRYANQAYCPKCGVVTAEFYRVKGRRCFACVHCRHQLYPTAGTVFHGSRTSLRTWFLGMYLFSVSKNGVSAHELQRWTGTTYKTAWRMARQIRMLMTQGSDFLRGVVEADEAYIGGRRRSSNRFANKISLLGVVERGGEARVLALNDHPTKRNVLDFLGWTVEAGSTLQTDESYLYHDAAKIYRRKMVNHSGHMYVDGDNYTNTIEGFWGQLKPSLDGTYRSVSKKYLQLYVNEFVWRYNHRKDDLCPLLVEASARPIAKDS